MKKTRLIYAAGENDANMRYATGFSTPDPYLWFQVDDESCFVASPLEAGRAIKQVRQGVTVLTTSEAEQRYKVDKSTAQNQTAALINALSTYYGVEHWNVPDNFPLGLAYAIDRKITLLPEDVFFPEREIKTPQDIQAIEDAIRQTEAGLQKAVDILTEATITADGTLRWQNAPLTAELLRSEVNIAIARLDATAEGTICAPGPQGADPHCTGFGPIRANTPIVLDVFPRNNTTGYFGDLTRTLLKGNAPDEVKKAYDTVAEAQQLAFSLISPTRTGAEVHNAIADFFKTKGYQTDMTAKPAYGFFHGLGHSIGLDIHESPSLSPRNTRLLIPGNVVTVEPGLYYPQWGGIRIEDDVVVTPNGCRRLSHFPTFLEIK